MAEKPAPVEGINLQLIDNFERIKGDRGFEQLRKDMAEAGYAIGNGTLQRIAAGDAGVRMHSLKKLGGYARMSVQELLGGEDGPFIEIHRADVRFSNGTGSVVYHEDDKPPI
mgnify:CR=1 FL=1